MFFKLNLFLSRLKQFFNIYEWLVKILGLPIKGNEHNKGLILIQIDGLSMQQLSNALKKSKMPFLNYLLKKEEYNLRKSYSGLPSTTPAVQGELFYGKKTIVPSFDFADKEKATITNMLEGETAKEIEKELEKDAVPLLKNGASYCNIYTGGAEDANYCASSFGISEILSRIKTTRIIAFLILYFISLVKSTVLVFVEIYYSFVDLVKGVLKKRELFYELSFIPKRLAIVVLLRELVRCGVEVDICRGVPIIHANFVGYDEQSHRRGPSSKFAHWALKGIDNSIRKIWYSAKNSSRLDYDIWIYSDHGQHKSTSFYDLQYNDFNIAVEEILQKFNIKSNNISNSKKSMADMRSVLIGGKILQKLLLSAKNKFEKNKNPEYIISSMGPVSHLYFRKKISGEEIEKIAEEIAKKLKIPGVLCKSSDNENILIFKGNEKFFYDKNSEVLYGKKNDLANELKEDIERLIKHKYAGDIVFFGFSAKYNAINFSRENGSHGDIGEESIRPFVLVPEDAPLPSNKKYLRPLDIRKSVFDYFDKTQSSSNIYNNFNKKVDVPKKHLRVMTYNIHHCVGLEGKFKPDRICKIISKYNPDLIALQEVDVNRNRSEYYNIPSYLAEKLGFNFLFNPTVIVTGEEYGNAVLSRQKLDLVKAEKFPSYEKREPRGAIWSDVIVDGKKFSFINTHLGLKNRERLAQCNNLLSENWLKNKNIQDKIIICGDFNSFRKSKVCKKLNNEMLNVSSIPGKTFKTWMGVSQLDYIFVSPGINTENVYMPENILVKRASDHLPLIADIVL